MWGDPGVTELMQLNEDSIVVPALSGGQKSATLSRAGLLRRMRFYMKSSINVSTNTTGPGKSPYGPLAAIDTISIKANGATDIVSLSGLGAAVYNEIENRDGSVLAHPSITSSLGMSEGAALANFDTIADTDTGDETSNFPFEFQLGIPVWIKGLKQEIGLWLLQNQAIDVNVKVNFNPLYSATASNEALWSGGTGIAATLNAASELQMERELYEIPSKKEDLPDLRYAHQIIEHQATFTGSFSRFNIPRAGALLRVIVINLDSNGDPIEWSDVASMKWVYGANRTPVDRAGNWLEQEYLQDYGRHAPKGAAVLDFYKWGLEGLKLVKDTESLANLRIETTFSATTTGTQRIILDRLYPVATTPA